LGIYIHEKGSTQELGNDLFPRNFIVNTPPPSNYMSPVRIFGLSENAKAGLPETRALLLVRPVTDYAETVATNQTCDWMPPRLVARTGHRPLDLGQPRILPTLNQSCAPTCKPL
jgi:hypothetical protein